jgi:tetratricopeptide (TPR) repeat protein
MDCRRSLVASLSLAAGLVGCAHNPSLPLQSNTAATSVTPPPGAKIVKESEVPKHPPHATTCVKFGAVYEQQAEDEGVPPTERRAKYEMALKAYQQALTIDPNCVEASLALARLHAKLGDHPRAVTDYEKILKARPKDAAVWYEAGMYYGQHKEWQPSLRCLQQAAKLEPENRKYTNSLGFAFARCGQYDESYELFRKTVGEAKAHYHLAQMLHHLQQDELSKQQLQLALQADPNLTPAQQMLVQLQNGAAPAVQPVQFQAANQ